MRLITLDWETHYAQDYSLRLKRYNTSGYIRDPQFQVHGVGIKIDNGKTRWYAGHAAAKKAIDAINWSDAALLAHNTAFDGAILAWHFGHIAAFYYDTLSMTRGLHNEVSRASLKTIAALYQLGEKDGEALENTKGKRTLTKDEAAKLGAYCVQDVELCHAIFKKQRVVFPESELALIDLTLRMFIQPVFQINLAVAEKALAEELEERNWLICASGVPESTLRSNDKFALALTALGVEVPMKLNKKGEQIEAFAQSDEEFLDLLEHDDRRIVRLAAGRLAAKSTLFETRGRRLIDDGTGGRRLPVLLNYFGAKTGRWSGGNKCLVGYTTIIIERQGKVMYSMLSALTPSDRVWDGREFVSHDGLVHQGLAEVMSYGGITGTGNHQVWVEEVDYPTERLDTAEACGHTLRVGRLPAGLEPLTPSMSDCQGPLHQSEEQSLSSLWRTWPDFQIRYRQPHGRMGNNQSRVASIAAAQS